MFPVTVSETPDITSDNTRYRRLWLTVILRAKLDAEGHDLMYESDGATRRLKREGRQWLTGDTIMRPLNREQLEDVCEMAGVDVKELVGVSRRRYCGSV